MQHIWNQIRLKSTTWNTCHMERGLNCCIEEAHYSRNKGQKCQKGKKMFLSYTSASNNKNEHEMGKV